MSNSEVSQGPAVQEASQRRMERIIILRYWLTRDGEGRGYGIPRPILIVPAFVIDHATHDRLVAEDLRSAEVLKPFLRGRDLGRYTIHQAGLWLICIENAGEMGRRADRRCSRFGQDVYWPEPAGAGIADPSRTRARAARCRHLSGQLRDLEDRQHAQERGGAA